MIKAASQVFNVPIFSGHIGWDLKLHEKRLASGIAEYTPRHYFTGSTQHSLSPMSHTHHASPPPVIGWNRTVLISIAQYFLFKFRVLSAIMTAVILMLTAHCSWLHLQKQLTTASS